MKKIIFLVSCILNLVGMQSPKPNFTEEEINLRLRFSPFERAVVAILQNDQDSLNALINRNPKLLEFKSPSLANAGLLDVAKVFKRDNIARSLIITDNQEVKRDSPIKSLSALHIAAEFDDEELAKFLLNNGQCPETIDENGIRPISVSRNKNNSVHKIYKNYLDGYIADDEK
jgi:hypothetical protein